MKPEGLLLIVTTHYLFLSSAKLIFPRFPFFLSRMEQ